MTLPSSSSGTYVRIRPHEDAWTQIENPKAVLEEHLSYHYCSLSQGMDVWIHWQGSNYRLLVEECQPAESIQIVEAQLEVELLSPLWSTSAPHLEVGRTIDSSVGKDLYTYFSMVPTEETNKQDLRIIVDALEGDPDLYVSTGSRQPTLVDHQWMAAHVGSVQLVIPSSKLSRSRIAHVGIHGYGGPARFRITLLFADPQEHSLLVEKTQTTQSSADMKLCPNCLRYVASESFAPHEAFCQRTYSRCVTCDQAIPRAGLVKHKELFHSPLECSCGASFSLDALRSHKQTDCPKRLVACSFCENVFQARTLPSHAIRCSASTAPCPVCGVRVTLQEQAIHQANHHHHHQAEQSTRGT